MATEAHTVEPVALLERGANSQLSPAVFNQPTEIADYLVKSENVKTSTDVLVESGINGNARPLEGEGFVESSTVANVVGEQTYHAHEKVDAVEDTGTNDSEVTDRIKEIEGKGITNNEFGHVKNECADVVENGLVLVAEKQTDGSKQNEEEGKETDKSDEQETIREVSSLGQTKEGVIHTAEHKLNDSDDSVETITDCIENESKDAITSTVTEITQESTGDRSLGMAISINQNDSREIEVIENKIDQPSVLLSTIGAQFEVTPSVACKEEHKDTEILDKTGEADNCESEKGREEKNPEKKLDDLVSNHEEGKQSVGEEQILSEPSAGEGRGENVHTILVAEDSITEVACPDEIPGPKENLMQKDEPENEKIESSQKVSKETQTAASNEIKNQEDYFDEEAKAEKSNETNVISDTGIPNEEISPPTTLDEKAQGADVEIENKNADDWHPNRSLEQEITLPEGEKLEKSSDFKHQELVDKESGVSTREETTPKLVSQTTETKGEKLKGVSDSKDNLDIKDEGKNMEEGDPRMEISTASGNDIESKDEEKSVSNDNIVEQTFEPENIQEAETTLQAEVGEDVKEKIPEENVKSNSQESVGENQTKDLQSDGKITGQSSTENFEEHETARTIKNAVKEKNQTLAVEPITNVKEATDKEDPREDIKEKDQSTEVSEEIASKDIIEVQEIIQTAAEAEDTDKQDSVVEEKIEVIAREMHEDPLQKEKEDDLDITDLKEEIKDSKTEFTEPVEERGYVEERESETLKDNEEPNSELTPAKASEETMLQKDVNESLAKIPTLDEESKEETFEKEKHNIDESNNASTATKETKHEEGESEVKVEMENSTLARGKEPVEMGMESDKLHQMDVDAESENDTNLDESRDPEIAVVENEVEEQIEHGIQKEAPIAGTEDQTNATASETPSAHMSDDILKECSTMPSQESDLVTSEASDIVDENAEEKSKSSLTEVVAEEKARAEVEAGTDNKELEAADTENTEILTQQECASKTMTEESQEIIRDTNQSELGEKMTNFQNESSEFVEQKSQEEGHHETQEKEEPKEPRDLVKETQNADEMVKAVILTEEVQDVEKADGEDKTVKLANEEKEGIKESHTELTVGESVEKAEESMSTEQPKESDSNEQGETVNSDVQEDSVMEKEIMITKQTEETLEQDEADEKSSSTAAVQESEEKKKEITEEAYSSHDKIKEITTSETSLDETQIDEKPAQATDTTEDESSLGTVEVEASQQGDVVNSIAVEENSSNLASQHLAENNENATEEQIEDADADADEAEERKKASDVDVVHESVDHCVEASQPSLEFNEDKKDESQDETDERKEAPEVISEASLQTLPVQRFDEQNKTSSELLPEEQEDGISALMDVVAEEEISSDQTLLSETLNEQNQTKKTEEVSLHMELPEEHGIQKESPKEVREDEDCGESKEDIKEVAGLSSRPDSQNFKAPKEDEIASDTTLVTEEKSEEKIQTPSDAMIDETPATSDRIEQHMQEEENIEKNACFSTQGTKEVEALEVEIEKDNANEVSNKDGGTPEELLKLQPHENPSEDVESEKITSSEVQSYEKTMESEESEVKEKHLVAAIPYFVQTNQPKETVDATDVAGNEITDEEIADKKEEWESSPPVTLNEETAKESSQLHELTAEERLGDDMIEKEIQNKKVDEEVEKTDDSETIEKEIVEARIAEPLDQAGVKKEINNDSFAEAEEGDNDKEDQIERDLEKQDDQTVVGQGSRAEAVTVTEKESGAEISDVKESVGDVEISSDENLPIAKSGESSEIPSAREKTEGATSINEYVEVITKEVEVAEDVSSITESVSLPKEGDRKLKICHSKCPLDAEEQKEAPKEVHEEEDIAPAETREEIKKEVDCESVSNSDSQGFESTKEEEIISGETLATGKKLEDKSQTPSADLVSEITTLLEKTEDRAKPEDTQGDNKLQTKEREFQGLALEKESKEAGEVPDEAFKLESQENGTEIKETECPTKNEEIVGLSKETSDLETNISEETSKSKPEICSSEVKDTQREEAITYDTNELMLKEVINEGIKEDKDYAKGTPLMVGSEVTTKECHQKPEGKPEESLEDQKTMEEPQTEEEVGTEISNAKEAVEYGTFTTDKSLPVAEFDEIQSVALLSEEQKHGASGTTDCIKEGMKGVEGTEQPKTMEEVPLQKEESSELGVSQVETQLDKYVLETPKEVHEGESITKEMEVSGDVPIIMEEASWQKEELTGPEISESKRPLDAVVQKDSQKESAPIETKEESKEEEVSTEISDAEEAVEEDKITSDKSLPDSKLEEDKEIQSVAMLSEEQKHGTSETTECIKEVTEEVEGTEDEPKTTEEVPLQKEEPGELGLSQLETHPEKYIEETPKEVHEGEATAKEVEMMGDVPNKIEEESLQKEEPRGVEISESKQLLDADAQMDSQKEVHEEEDKALIETEEEIKEEEVGTDISESKEAVEEDKNIRDKSLPVAKLEEQNEIQSVALLSEEQKQGTSATTHCMKEVTKGVEGTEVEPKTMEKVPLQKEEPRELEVLQVETQLDKYVQETLKEVHEGEATTKEVELIGDAPNIMEEASLQKEEPEESEISESYRLLDADLVSEITTLLEKTEDRAKPEDTQGDNKLQTKKREFKGLALEKESKEAGEVPDEAFKLESQENGTEIKDTECPTKNEEIVGLSKETSDLETNISEETSKSKPEICSSEVKDTQREEAITNDTNELMLKEVINEGIKEDKDYAKGTPLMVGSEVTTKECHQKPEGKPEESLEDQKTMEEPQTQEDVGTEISNAKEAVEDGTFATDKSLPVAEFDEIQSVALLSEEQKHGASGTTDCIKEGMKGVEGTEQPKTMEEVPLQKEESSELGVSQVETQLDKYALETPKEVHEGEAITKEMEVSGDVPIIMEEASWQKEEPTGPEISESKRPLDADVQMDSQKESAPIETKEESKEEEVSTEISDAEEAVEEDKITSDKSLPDSKLEEEKEIQSVAMLSEEQKHGTSETTECIKEVTEEVEGTEDEPKTTEEVPLQKEEPGELGFSQLETHPEKYIEETPKEVHEGEATAKEVEMMRDVPNKIEEASLQKEEPRGAEISESKQLLDADAQMDSQKEVHEEEDKALIEAEEEIKEEEVGTDISESKEAVEEKNIRDKSLPVAKLEEQNEIQSVALLSEEQKQGTSGTTHCMKEVTKEVEGTEVEPKTMEKVPLQKEEPRELEVFQVETQLDKYVQETLKEVHEGEVTTKEVEVIGGVPNIVEEASLQKEEPEESEISESYRLLDADVKMDSQNEVHAEEDIAPIETKEEVESKSASNSDSQVSEAPKEDKITSAEALTTEEKSEEQSRMPFSALVSETTLPSEKEEQEKAVETPEDDNMKISATPHDLQAQGLVLDKDQSLEEEKTINEAVKLASEEKKTNITDEKCLHESERVTKIVGLPEGTSNIKNEISEEILVSESEIHSNEVITEPGKTETKEEQAEEAIATKIVDNEVINEEVAEHKDALPMTVTEVTSKECHQEPHPNLDESLENKTTEELQTKEDFSTEISGAKKEIVEEKVTSDEGLLMAKSDRRIQIQSAALRLEEQTQGASATIESRKEAAEDIEGIIDEPKTTEEVPLQKEAHREFEGSKLEMESPKEVQEEESEATGKTKEETKGAPETPLMSDSNEIEDKSDSNSQEISAALASETTTILEKIEDPKREVETPGNENPQISKEESKETEAGKLPGEASKLENQENKSKTKHAECPPQPETTSNLKAEQTSKLDSEIQSYEVVPKPVETEIIKNLLEQEKNDLQQNTIDTVKVQQIKVTDEQVTESKQGTNKESQQKYELKPENNTAAKDIQNEKVEKSQEEEGKTANAASGGGKTSEAEERGIAEGKSSLQDKLEKPTREWHHAAEETEEAKKAKSGGEEEDEEEEQKKHDSSGSDAPVMVEACREMEIKSPHKKSLLSGVGSKVKHSISKVKKAITGSGGGGKSSSQTKQQHSPK